MPIIRGFVEKLEIGRAGLVVASLRHDDGTTADYQIADLDADPERFNERLSKLGILRDAMTRAEPVEIEYGSGEGSGPRTIDRVARITRDGLEPSSSTQRASVMVAGIALSASHRTGARAEASDIATVVVLAADGALASLTLDLQMPERDVASAMLAMLRQAQADGTAVTVVFDAKQRRIVGVETGDPSAAVSRGDMQIVEGFVESVAVSPMLAPMGNLALVEFTTAPAFAGAGNVVGLVPFTPVTRQFLVVQGSLEYELFLAGLRDKLRMRLFSGAEVAQSGGGNDDTGKPDVVKRMAAMTHLTNAPTPAPGAAAAAPTEGQKPPAAALVRAAQLLAALASASRPVWIQISRQSLDEGPAGDRCTEGLPSSDLTPMGLRDLRIPYTAQWQGLGCFNPGVYRLQFTLGVEFEVQVDGKPLCVHASADGTVKFAHACLCGDHEVRVVLKGWTCKMKFEMDVYRIR
jgi:hypothetical protein